MPKIDDFLSRIGMPNKVVHPEYLPPPLPKPTGFAAITDIDAVPYLTEAGRAVYRRYLDKPIPKLLVISPSGYITARYGGFDPLHEALEDCKHAHHVCRVYAVDNNVVWIPFSVPKRPLLSHYASLEDVDSVPYMAEAGRDLYKRFLAKSGPRALVITSSGSAYARYGAPDPFTAAWLSCQNESSACEPYAINDDVVWVYPKSIPAPTHFAQLENVEAVPYLKPGGRHGYQSFLIARKPRAFVIAHDGAWESASRGPDPVKSALDACSKLHQECRLYAVDDAVVWHE
jgi:hypothetical protein